jgi:Ni,Fe-hydrogenase maturation factor
MSNVNEERAILIGIGNNLFSGDGVGPFLAGKIGQKLGFLYGSVFLLSLDPLGFVLNYQVIFIFDLFRNLKIPVGEAVPFNLNDLDYQHNPTYSHGITLSIIFNIGEKIYPRMPEKVHDFGINVYDNQTISESFSEAINYKMDKMRNHLLKNRKR